ncbi:MAG TPA: hypothetical protein PK089_08520 [Methanoregulaceae archaeon]|nr:hypothetical protein [Methanoregulaceae archaeon]HQJ88032.1 hypothetical protein [Methanoregulaceae archaeon]
MQVSFRRYTHHLVRWQSSTPLPAVALVVLASIDPLAPLIATDRNQRPDRLSGRPVHHHLRAIEPGRGA